MGNFQDGGSFPKLLVLEFSFLNTVQINSFSIPCHLIAGGLLVFLILVQCFGTNKGEKDAKGKAKLSQFILL